MWIFLLFGIIIVVASKPQGYMKYGLPQDNSLQYNPLQYILQPPPPQQQQQQFFTVPQQNLPPIPTLTPKYIPALPETILRAPPSEFITTPSHNLISTMNSYSTPPSVPTYLPPLPPPVPTPQQPIIKKYFYFHSAPPEPEEKPIKVIKIGQPRKTYRVVFIKTPTPSRQQILISAVPDEEKTVVYVLTKQNEPSEIQTEVNITPTEPSKPEVFFIKYKTPEEAEHAQHQIQAQYDALGGTSEVNDEALAPITSVIGHLDPPTQQNEQQINAYLPPSKFS